MRSRTLPNSANAKSTRTSLVAFIDANIFLSFYRYSKDDLAQLQQLSDRVQSGDVHLIVTRQLRNEIERNRAAVIADTLKRLQSQSLKLEFPNLCRGYEYFSELTRLQQEYEKAHSRLIERIQADALAGCLDADRRINALLDAGTDYPETPGLLQNAKDRVDCGDPPGKRGSLGDAINWLTLLEQVIDGKELYLASADDDYSSPLDDDRDPFLVSEWKSEKGTSVHYYRNLRLLLKDIVPTVQLGADQDDEQKRWLLFALNGSRSFRETHRIIAQLNAFDEFSQEDVTSIVNAALHNSQVRSILADRDVNEFVKRILSMNSSQVPPEELSALYDAINMAEASP